MNNVVTLNTKQRESTIDPFPEYSDLYFHVHEYDMSLVPKKYAGGMHSGEYGGGEHGGEQSYDAVVQSHKALVRNIDDKPVPIAVVGRNYNVVQNEPLFRDINSQFCKALSDRELTGAQVKDSVSYQGQTCIREYIFPNVRCKTEGKSDIAFRTIVVNGFGGSSFKLMLGAIDFFCTNGMVVGEFDAYYHRHTKGLKVQDVVERIRRGIDVFYKQADVWQRWMKKELSADDVQEFLKSLPGMSPRRAAQLERQYYIESRAHGATVWALYSAMTYFATHNEGEFRVRDTGNDNVAATLLKREEQVKRWSESSEWKRIAA